MSAPRVTPVLNEFNKQVTRSLSLVNTVMNINKTYPRILHKNQVYMIFELSFLKIFLAWEQFIEDSFIRYMINGKTDTGYAPSRYVKPKNLKHAFDLVKKERREYADWTNPHIVIEKAELFFKSGEPYKNVLHSMITHIQDMKTIRNAIVHISADSMEKFKTLARSKLSYAPSGITPGKFLSSLIPGQNLTYIEDYKNKLATISSFIVR